MAPFDSPITRYGFRNYISTFSPANHIFPTNYGLPKCTPYPQPREVDGVPFLTCIKCAFPLMCSSLCFASWICGHLDIWRLLLNHSEPRMVLGKTLSIISLVYIVFFQGWNRHS